MKGYTRCQGTHPATRGNEHDRQDHTHNPYRNVCSGRYDNQGCHGNDCQGYGVCNYVRNHYNTGYHDNLYEVFRNVQNGARPSHSKGNALNYCNDHIGNLPNVGELNGHSLRKRDLQMYDAYRGNLLQMYGGNQGNVRLYGNQGNLRPYDNHKCVHYNVHADSRSGDSDGGQLTRDNGGSDGGRRSVDACDACYSRYGDNDGSHYKILRCGVRHDDGSIHRTHNPTGNDDVRIYRRLVMDDS